MTAARTLLVDDDERFRERLAISLTRRGHQVRTASSSEEAFAILGDWIPENVLLDLRLGSENGIESVAGLRRLLPDASIVMLTGYGSIASALEAVRLGANDYLTKPADADQIEAAFSGKRPDPVMEVPSLDRVEWEHLQRVLADCDGNVSQASRVLGIDRRSLQRKLAKFAPGR